MARRGKLFVVSAPSGTGKTTVVNFIVGKYGPYFNLSRVVTYTTKKPHKSEQNGTDYNFVSKKEFEQKAKEDFFIEHSTAYGHYYGSPFYIIHELDIGKSYILVLDQKGAENVLKMFPESILIWFSPPDINILQQRLEKRARDSREVVARRLQLAEEEMSRAAAATFYKYHIINSRLFQSVKRFERILKKELQI